MLARGIRGFWELLELSMQMALIIITGNIIATSPPVRRFLSKMAMKPNNMGQAVLLVLAIVPILNWFHFGLGIMSGIQLGRMIIFAAHKKGYKIHTPMFVAFLYGVGITGVGISQIAQIISTVPGWLQRRASDDLRHLVPESVSLSQTAFLWQNVVSCVLVLIAVFSLIWIMRPKKTEDYEAPSEALIAEIEAQAKIGVEKVVSNGPAEKLDNSYIPSLVIGIFGLLGIAVFFATGGRPDFNGFNFMMLILGVLLCGSPNKFIKSVQNSIGSTWGIIIQFPFYAGIFGLIFYTGLNHVIVEFFLSFANARNWPFVAYIYTSILNFAVPNGAAKFPLVVSYLVDVTARLGADWGTVLNAYTAGDISTNGFIPFWALPYLAMFKLDFKKVLPYVVLASLGAYVIYGVFFLFIY